VVSVEPVIPVEPAVPVTPELLMVVPSGQGMAEPALPDVGLANVCAMAIPALQASADAAISAVSFFLLAFIL